MSPGVVHISSLNAAGKPERLGSGFVIDPAGTIVTAYHVIRGATGAMVKTSDGEIYDRIDVVQYDLRRDIAVLKIQPFRQLKALRLASDDDVLVGDEAAAIGNPQGLEATVSAGIISGHRQVEGFRLVQTTVPVSPGSSGGPLFNMAGEVVGIVAGGVDNARGQNLNFAVPVVYIRTLLKAETTPIPLSDFTKRVATSPQAAFGPSVTEHTTSDSWTVLHAHRNFEDACTGTITVSSGRIVFTSGVPGHGFDEPATSITEVKLNSVLGASMRAFHVNFIGGVNHNFVHVDENRTPRAPGHIIYAINMTRRGRA